MNTFEVISILLKLFCGIALFLYGMSVMGDGLKKVAGNKLEALLYKLTNTPLKGLLLGCMVTAVIQSSAATSVMVVGFVNSGMMKVAQAISIVMGANIGTSITGWVLCLSYIEGSEGIASLLSTTTISALFAIIGIVLKNFTKKDSNHHLGEIMLGFAVLMSGLKTMSGAVEPLREVPAFVNMLTSFTNPIMGALAGMVFTAILQSASAGIGILQALSMTGAITFASAFPIIMGIGVGAACPVILSAVGASKNGMRTAISYLINDTFGLIVWSIVFYSLNALVGGFGFMGVTMTPVLIAIVNSLYRILNITVLSFFIKPIEKLIYKLIKESDEDLEEQKDFDLLEERFLAYPDLAIAQAHTAINGMAKKARKNFYRAMKLFRDYSDQKFTKVQEKENLIDKYEDKLGTYMMKLSGQEMTVLQSHQSSKFLHTISDFERIADHASALSKVAKELYEKKMQFSEEAQAELEVLERATAEIIDITVRSFVDDNVKAVKAIEPLRQYITTMCSEMKSRHIMRLQLGQCDMAQGFPFNDMLTNMDRIAAHCSNIAIAMIELDSTEFDPHTYVKSVQSMKNDEFVDFFNSFVEKYPLPKREQEVPQVETTGPQSPEEVTVFDDDDVE